MITIKGATWTKENIDFVYNLYVNAVIELGRVCPIIEVGIFDKSPSNLKMDTINPYLTEDDEWLTNLGQSVIDNGTHWVYIVRNRKFVSGNHRIMSLRALAEKGTIKRDHKVLCIDVTNSTFGKGLPIKTLRAKELDEIVKYGFDTIRHSCVNYKSWIEAVLRIPKMFKEVLYGYKKLTGKEYKSLLVINDIDELKRRVEDNKNNGKFN